MILIGTLPDFEPAKQACLQWAGRDVRTQRITYSGHFQSASRRPLLLQALAELDRRHISWSSLVMWGAREFGIEREFRRARTPREPERSLVYSCELERRLLAAVRAAAYEPDIRERLTEHVRSTNDVLALCAYALASSDDWFA